MLKFEEYIAKRKKEDSLNEFDINARNENLKACVDYVFEYYTNYLNINETEEKTILKNEKLDKYRQQLNDYALEANKCKVQADFTYTFNKKQT